MDEGIRKAQLKVLEIFAQKASTGAAASAGAGVDFALSGGTALERYYLKHRFSKDLDFFSPKYDLTEIRTLVDAFSKGIGADIRMENEFTQDNRAKVRFYTAKIRNSQYPLKIDFIEDVHFENPNIEKFDGVRVYNAHDIYFQKINAITGTRLRQNGVGREVITGRGEIRDVVDVYYLSKKTQALHLFLKSLSREYQRGMIQWYRSFSRGEFKFGFLDLDVYDKELSGPDVIRHLEGEIETFMEGELSDEY